MRRSLPALDVNLTGAATVRWWFWETECRNPSKICLSTSRYPINDAINVAAHKQVNSLLILLVQTTISCQKGYQLSLLNAQRFKNKLSEASRLTHTHHCSYGNPACWCSVSLGSLPGLNCIPSNSTRFGQFECF